MSVPVAGAAMAASLRAIPPAATLTSPPAPLTGATTHTAVGLGEAHVLRAGLAALAGPTALVAYGLGSCVAICLWDQASSVAGMAHVVLPGADPRGEPNPKFARSALPALLQRMAAAGAATLSPRRLQARLVGGAHVLAIGGGGSLPRIGEANAAAAREALAEAGIAVVGEELGGTRGRTVWLHAHDGGRLRVRSVDGKERFV